MTAQARKKAERRTDALSREQIVEAAIELLDAAGESGLTFRALSERLATGPGAIYWHVAGKGELLAAATERVVDAALPAAVDGGEVGAGAVAGAVAGPAADADRIRRIHAVALGLFDAIEAHPWLAAQIAGQLSHDPTGPVTTRIFETVGRQVSATDVPASSWFTGTSALVHYILGAAGQNAANLRRARSLDPDVGRTAYFDTVARAWKQLSPKEYPFTRAVAEHGLDHDDRAQFLAGIDLIVAGLNAAASQG